MEKWRLWVCPTCKAETKLNYVADRVDYDRIKRCICGCNMEFKTDTEE